MKFGTDTYRNGALERLEDSRQLFERHRYVSAFYCAGLAVEGMLRSLIWLREKRFDGQHNLRNIAIRLRDLGLLHHERDDNFVAKVEAISRSWLSNLRFADESHACRWFKESASPSFGSSANLRYFVEQHYRNCSDVIKRCEVIWNRERKNK